MKSLFRLIRWQNLLFSALIVWLMEKMVAVPLLDKAWFGEQLPSWMLILLMLAVVFIAAGGYAINDYFDVKIDNINRPDKVIVTRDLTKQQAMLVHQIMTFIGAVLGLVVAWKTHSWSLALIFIFIPGLLWFYSSSYKRQFIIGNLIVSFCAAIVPFIIAIANNAYINHFMTERFGDDIMQYSSINKDLYIWIGGFSLFAFLTTLTREIVKDMQDQTGDRELECHTMPIVIGELWTKIVLTLLLFIIAALACYAVFVLLPFEHHWSSLSVRYLMFGLLVPLCCELYLLWTAKIPSDYRFAQGLMKFIMFTGVLYSVIIRVLLK